MYQFRTLRGQELEDFLLDYIGIDAVIPSDNPDTVKFLHNGDTMEVNLATGEMSIDTIHPGELGGSKIMLRLHNWLWNGTITTVPAHI